MRKFRKRHRSPLYQVADALKGIAMEKLEIINPFTLSPWEERIQTITEDLTATQSADNYDVRIAVSSSARNGVVGIGGAVSLPASVYGSPKLGTFSSTLGARSEQNPYSGELAAMERALSTLPMLRSSSIVLSTNNKAAVLTLRQPRQQSGQQHTRHIYEAVGEMRKRGNIVAIRWLPASEGDQLLQIAKENAREATHPGATPEAETPRMRSTTLNVARSKTGASKHLPEKVGNHSKRVDTALPGKHTTQLYDRLTWKEATVLAQLRTGMARLNAYLHRIGVAPSEQCACGQAAETVKHFLFRCRKWTAYRMEMLRCTNTHRSNISFYLGGKSASDNKDWSPNLEAVRATIRFAIATGRLDANQPSGN
jgi:ribonuclease HI